MRIGTTAQFVGGEKLPYDAEVEYLESNGNGSYIDFGTKTWDNRCECYFKASALSTSRSGFIGNGWFLDAILEGGSTPVAFFGYDYSLNVSLSRIDFGVSVGNPFSISVKRISDYGNKAVLITKNEKVSYYCDDYWFSFTEKNSQIILFKRDNEYFNGRFYSISLKHQDETGIIDAIPVRVGTVGYMYDRVSKTLFGNAGTGAFIVGPDVSAANGGGGV